MTYGHDSAIYGPVERRTSDGRPYVLWEALDLRRVPDPAIQSVVFLYPTADAAVRGTGYGGSGFLVAITGSGKVNRDPEADVLDDPPHVYVVTNAHVAANCAFVRTGHPLRPIVRVDNWTVHPDGDDVAIAHLGIVGVTPIPLVKVIHTSMFVTADSFAENQVGAGDEVFMVGRFTGLDERERSEPTVRAGILSMASTIRVVNSEWGNVQQESFFAEVNSKSGYSGSPVYISIPLEIPPVRGVVMHPPRPQFLGLLGMTWGLWRGYAPLLDPDTHQPTPDGGVIHESSGIELVVPAWRIEALLMDGEVVEYRARVADATRKAVRRLKPDAVATDAVPEPDALTLSPADLDQEPRKVSRH